jgi:hypothetical protein
LTVQECDLYDYRGRLQEKLLVVQVHGTQKNKKSKCKLPFEKPYLVHQIVLLVLFDVSGSELDHSKKTSYDQYFYQQSALQAGAKSWKEQ